MTKRADFIDKNQQKWGELEALLGRTRPGDGDKSSLGRRLGRRKQVLSAPQIVQLGRLHRATSADLALARRQFPGDPVVGRLEQLISRSHQEVYAKAARQFSFVDFATRGYWWEVRRRPWPLALAALFLLGPLVGVALWAHQNLETAIGFAGPVDPASAPQISTISSQASFAATIFTHNIEVAFAAFGGGISGGLLSSALLIFNGLTFGAITGVAIGSGSGPFLFERTAAHGVLELSQIIVAGAAGLRLGWAAAVPGTTSRLKSLTTEAVRTTHLVLGTAFWMIIAGLIEGFVTPRDIGTWPAVVVGFAFGGLYWALVVVLGKPPPETTTGGDPS